MKKKKETFFRKLWKQRAWVFLALPAFILLFMFDYMPMTGLVLAFKNFNYTDGLYNSPWCGLNNFRFLFQSAPTFIRIIRNTVAYYAIFTVVDVIFCVGIAIAINELVFKKWGKFTQSCMILPTFISYIAISFIAYLFLANNGLLNSIRGFFGLAPVNWYLTPKPWWLILTIVHVWKGVGYGSVLYLSALTGVDQQMYEAAALDGATGWQKIRYITLPMLVPMITTMVLLGLGNVLHSDTGLFYQVTKNSGFLMSSTQVMDSYVLNAIDNGVNFSSTAAVSLLQSVIGMILVVVTNLIVRRQAPENALF